MKIVDIHTHTFPERIADAAIKSLQAKCHTSAFTNGTQSMLASSMKEAGISCSVIQPVATSPSQVVSINNSSLRINESTNHTGILSFGAMHPDFDDYASELERISSLGIKGIKLHPVYQGLPIDDVKYIRILERCSELGLIVLIHAGYDIGFPGNDFAAPEKMLRAVRASGIEKVILAHMGGWRCWQEATDMFAGSGVYIDTAFSLGEFVPLNDGYYASREECMMLSPEEFVRMIETFGASHVLFGTDSPWASQSESLKAIRELPLSSREKERILSENALRLLELG